MTCEILAELGVGPLTNLSGGMIARNNAQFPIERAEPASLSELLDLIVTWFTQVAPLSSEVGIVPSRVDRL